MLFPTTVFAVFFILVFIGSWLLVRHRTLWKIYLLLASYVFYGWWDWRFLFLIALCSIVNYGIAASLNRSENQRVRRWLLILSIVFNLSVLGFFKYYKFFVLSAYTLLLKLHLPCSLPLLDIVLPVGISFFTFQAMSYVIDVYRREIPPASSLLDFSTYLAFFPQLVAGPIVRAKVMLPQFNQISTKTKIDAGRASTLILAGLFKKVVVANYLAQAVVDPVFAEPDIFSAPDILLAVYGYAIQIYCDFSAYSDIAIGVALLLGFRFPLNFNAPYFATSFRNFWQRWHISLSTWLRDYLYIPLGGSRRGRMKTYRNLILTFLLGGLWHGAQWKFVMWGLLHGFYLVFERLFVGLFGANCERMGRLAKLFPTKIIKLLGAVIVFHFVCLAWIFFRAADFSDAKLMLEQLGVFEPAELWSLPVVAMLLVGFGVQWLDGDHMQPVWNWLNNRSFMLQGCVFAVILTIILGLGPKGVAPFIYFQF